MLNNGLELRKKLLSLFFPDKLMGGVGLQWLDIKMSDSTDFFLLNNTIFKRQFGNKFFSLQFPYSSYNWLSIFSDCKNKSTLYFPRTDAVNL